VTIEQLMTHPVTILHRSVSGSADEYGNPLTDTDSTTDLLGYFQQTSAHEITVGQETYTSDAILILAAGTVIDGSDQALIDGLIYELVGPPARPWRPSTGEHHVSCRLQQVTG
jgi:hypothetical protein